MVNQRFKTLHVEDCSEIIWDKGKMEGYNSGGERAFGEPRRKKII